MHRSDRLSQDPEVTVSISHCSSDEKSQTPPGITLTQWDAGLGVSQGAGPAQPELGVSPSGSGCGTVLAQVGFQHLLVLDPLSRGFPHKPAHPRGQK